MYPPAPQSIDWNAFLFRLAHPSASGVDPVKEAVTIALAASCTVYVYSSQGNWSGSGFHVGGGRLITDSHVCPPGLAKMPHQIHVTFDGKQLLPATVGRTEPDIDAAILQCASAATKPAVTLGDSDLVEVGDQIALVSSPEGWRDSAGFGRIANIHQNANDPAHPGFNDILFIDVPTILPGSSGGVVVNEKGSAIGVILGMVGERAEQAIGARAVCPINKVKRLLG